MPSTTKLKDEIRIATAITKSLNFSTDSIFSKVHFNKYNNRSVLNSPYFFVILNNSNYKLYNPNETITKFLSTIDLLGLLNTSKKEFLDKEISLKQFSHLKRKILIHKKLAEYSAKTSKTIFEISNIWKLKSEIENSETDVMNIIEDIDLKTSIIGELERFEDIILLRKYSYSELILLIENSFEFIANLLNNDDLKLKYLTIYSIARVTEKNQEKIFFPDSSLGYLGIFPPDYSELQLSLQVWQQNNLLDFKENRSSVSDNTALALTNKLIALQKKFNSKQASYTTQSINKISDFEVSAIYYLLLLKDLILNNKEFIYSGILIGKEFIESLLVLPSFLALIEDQNIEFEELFIKLSDIFLEVINQLEQSPDNNHHLIIKMFETIIYGLQSMFSKRIDIFFKFSEVSIFNFFETFFDEINLLQGAFPGGLGEIITLGFKSQVSKIIDRINLFVSTRTSILQNLSKMHKEEYYKLVHSHLDSLWQIIMQPISVPNKDDEDWILIQIVSLIQDSNIFSEDELSEAQNSDIQNVKQYSAKLLELILKKIITFENNPNETRQTFSKVELRGISYFYLKLIVIAKSLGNTVNITYSHQEGFSLR